MAYGSTASEIVRVAAESEVARWVQRLRGRASSMEAVEAEGRPRALFVADEMLVDAADGDLIAELIERHGAEQVARKPLPPPPEGMGPNPGVDVGACRFRCCCASRSRRRPPGARRTCWGPPSPTPSP